MKVKVIIDAVQDIETGKVYKKGKTFELPEERARIGIEKGYIEEYKDVRTRKTGIKDSD